MSSIIGLSQLDETSGGYHTILPNKESGSTSVQLRSAAMETSLLVYLSTVREIGPYQLRWPLSILVYRDGDYYIAENNEFDLWCDGLTVSEAINGLMGFFSHEAERFLNTPEERMDLLARREKRKYQQWLQISEDAT